MWVRPNGQKAETDPKSGCYVGLSRGASNVWVYHVSIMGLSCTYHVVGTIMHLSCTVSVGTCRCLDYVVYVTVGTCRCLDYIGTCRRLDYVGTFLCLGIVGTCRCRRSVGTCRHLSVPMFCCHNVVGTVFSPWTTSAPVGAESCEL